MEAYRRNGIREYLVWRTYDRQVDWFYLEEKQYTRMQSDSNGIVYSRAFPGLRLDVGALVRGDLNRVLTELQTGLASEEHTAFVVRISQSATEE